MNKIIIATAVATAVAAGSYVVVQQQNSLSNNDVLTYIPSNTTFFSGQLSPFPLKKYLSSTPFNITQAQEEMLNNLYENNNPKLNFFLNIVKAYQDNLSNPDELIKLFGLSDEFRAYAYTLGLIPVIKTEVANPQAIWDLLDKNEKATGYTHTEGVLETVKYRSYRLTDANMPSQLDLIISINENMLTVTLTSSLEDPTTLSMALGLTKPEDSLANSGKIENIINKHNLRDTSITFLNHIELIKGLTTSDGNLLARQITKLEAQSKDKDSFNELRSPECAADFASVAKNWPQTIIGYNDITINKGSSILDMAVIVESKNQPILKALQALKGHIPAHVSNHDNVFALGLGLDVNQLSTSLTDIWQDLQTPTYSCQPLAKMQNSIAESGEALPMLGMSTMMAQGVKGASISILKYAVDERSLKNLDALITVSAEDPEAIFNSLKMAIPPLAQVKLTKDSDPIDLSTIIPFPAELDIHPELAIKGKHLVIYNGEESKKLANALTSEKLSQNGIYSLSMDFKEVFAPIISSLKLMGKDIPEQLAFLATYNTNLRISLDVNKNGIISNTYIENKGK